MSKEFDKYLDKEDLSSQKSAMAELGQNMEQVDKSQSPGDLESSYTENPRDAHKRELPDSKETAAEVGAELKEQGVEMEQDGLSKYPVQEQGQQEQDQQMEQNQELGDDEGR